jgi:uncharacterized protein (TIGR00290 family)
MTDTYKAKAIFNWSGGKDSALCLYYILKEKKYEVLCLLTSINEGHNRISMHGVRTSLLEEQTKSIGLPLTKMMMPEMPTMEAYEESMHTTLIALKQQGAEVSIFGDIFLADLRKYREDKLDDISLKGVFPLWKKNTRKLMDEFIALGFKTIVVCVNEKFLDKSFVGRIIDQQFLADLPPSVDPCGENGEFHTFVFDGPIFKNAIAFELGEVVYRKYEKPTATTKGNSYNCDAQEDETSPFDTGFWYLDLLHSV